MFARNASCRGGGDWPCRYERFLKEVDANVQTFEAVSTEEDEVSRFGEDDNGRCRSSAGVEHGKAHFALENATVRGLKAIDALGANRELLEERAGDPVVFTAGVDHDGGEMPTLIRHRQVGDFHRRPEDSHVVNHYGPAGDDRDHGVLPDIKSQSRRRRRR